MILKASQRGGGQNLAAHLMRVDDNEHVSIHELRGFASDNLPDALREVEAIARGTKCQQYLFSVSLSPPEGQSVPIEVFEAALDRIETDLGLEGQPRALVFHEKEGRRHLHGVWSRIRPDTMTACQMSFFKRRLMSISRDIYLEQGWKMPRGLENAAERNPTNFTLAEWQQAKRQGIDPRWLKQAVQECWKGSDGRKAFERSLEERGFFLARGDRRGFVVLDHTGEVHSLPRVLDVKTKDVRARLGEGEDLASVSARQKQIGERMTPAIRRHLDESRRQFGKRSAALGDQKSTMTLNHRIARAALEHRQTIEWDMETRKRAARLPTGLRGLWHRITGRYQEVRLQNETEAGQTRLRHVSERQSLIDRQLEQRSALQIEFRKLRRAQAEQLLELRKDVGRFLKFSRNHDAAMERSHRAALGLRLER